MASVLEHLTEVGDIRAIIGECVECGRLFSSPTGNGNPTLDQLRASEAEIQNQAAKHRLCAIGYHEVRIFPIQELD